MNTIAEGSRPLVSQRRNAAPARALAAAAVLLGMLMAYGGGGHLLAVIATRMRLGNPYDFRFAALLTNGVILLGSGLTHLIVSRGIARGNDRALRASALAAGVVSAYCLILLPVGTARDAAVPALALNLAFLTFLMAVAWRKRGERRKPCAG